MAQSKPQTRGACNTPFTSQSGEQPTAGRGETRDKNGTRDRRSFESDPQVRRLSKQPSLHTSQLGRLDNSHPHRKKSEKRRERIQKTFEREPRGGGYRDVLHYTRPDWQIG